MRAVERIRRWLEVNKYDGVILGRRDNYTWVSGGAKNHVLTSTEYGVAFYVISRDDIRLVADSSDLLRMSAEQDPLGARTALVPWYVSLEEYMHRLVQGKAYVSDTGIAGTENVQEELIELRMELSGEAVENYRKAGQLCARIVEGVCRETVPGDTEEEVSWKIKSRCLQSGISPDCVLVGADERILKYRHPMPTDKKIEKSFMAVLGGEKYGLNVSITRMVWFAPVPEEIRSRYEKTRYIFACMQMMMENEKTYGEYFEEVQNLYREVGYPEEWKMHHQGGPTGYGCREYVALPGMDKKIRTGQAYAWNPTIQGTKCEETTYLGENGAETFTRTGDWPCTTVATPYGSFETADILEKLHGVS